MCVYYPSVSMHARLVMSVAPSANERPESLVDGDDDSVSRIGRTALLRRL